MEKPYCVENVSSIKNWCILVWRLAWRMVVFEDWVTALKTHLLSYFVNCDLWLIWKLCVECCKSCDPVFGEIQSCDSCCESVMHSIGFSVINNPCFHNVFKDCKGFYTIRKTSNEDFRGHAPETVVDGRHVYFKTHWRLHLWYAAAISEDWICCCDFWEYCWWNV